MNALLDHPSVRDVITDELRHAYWAGEDDWELARETAETSALFVLRLLRDRPDDDMFDRLQLALVTLFGDQSCARSVALRTFHRLGLSICDQENRVRPAHRHG